MLYQIRQTNWQKPQDQTALQQVRLQVFVEEQHVPIELEWDEMDAVAIHVLAEDLTKQTPIGCARLTPTGQIGRVAVLSQWRKQGIATALMQNLLAIAQQQKTEVFLHAQTSSLKFYEKLGFRVHSDIFYEANIPHQLMKLNISSYVNEKLGEQITC